MTAIHAIPGTRDRLNGRHLSVATAARLKLKFAFGLFTDAPSMLLAAKELSRWGVPQARLSFVVCPGQLAATIRSAGFGTGRTQGAIIFCGADESAEGWISRLFLDQTAAPTASRPAAGCVAPVQPWAHERPARQLHDFLVGGGALLVVRLDSDAEQHVVCSSLLHHASQGVQTHEIRRCTVSATKS